MLRPLLPTPYWHFLPPWVVAVSFTARETKEFLRAIGSAENTLINTLHDIEWLIGVAGVQWSW